MSTETIISPVNGQPFKTFNYAPTDTVVAAAKASRTAQKAWAQVPLPDKVRLLEKVVDAFAQDKDGIAQELAWQMGRPVRYGAGEVNGFIERAQHMFSIAPDTLATVTVPDKPGFKRYIKREPVGVVFVVSAWNYPVAISFLFYDNWLMGALLAGNTVILKHAPQTFLCGERLARAFEACGVPKDIFQCIHMTHATADSVIQQGLFDLIVFTGSVRGGRQIVQSAAKASNLVGTALELGGNDPAYVRSDADVGYAAENIVDGAMFNSGQSCCGIERVYVHETVYDAFVEAVVKVVKGYVLGDPLKQETTLGPVVTEAAAKNIREHIQDAVSKGAKALIELSLFPQAKEGTAYVAPQVLVNVTHAMKVMADETFGPVMGIMKVKSDEEAITLMNDSQYGLTASIWTEDVDKAAAIGDSLETGTVFANRCDYLDPSLAWVGVKLSGRGCSLSKFGYDQLTRPKSYHLRTAW